MPIIGIPVAVDQPLVAYRVCDELGLGIRCKHGKMTVVDIKRAVYRILTYKFFAEQMHSLSVISKKTRGLSDAIQICYKLMNLEPTKEVE